MSKVCCLTGCGITIGVLSVAAVVLGLLATTIFESMLQSDIKKKLIVDEGDMSTKSWDNFTNTHIDQSYFIFNITNLDTVLKKGMPCFSDGKR